MKAFLAGIVVLVYSCAASAETPAVEQGRAIFRSNCAFCHGITGLGGRGPNLVAGERKSDDEVKRIIKNGVPGSTMPAFNSFETEELNKLVDFIKYLAGANVPVEKVTGDAVKGKLVYDRNGCAGCHMSGEHGSTFGPDLSRIGGARSLHYLQESIVEPSGDIPDKYEGVTVVTKDGKRITGIRANEDTFSVQLRLPSQAYRSFIKDEVKEVIHEKNSLMPAYKKLPKEDLDNLIAYLNSLRGKLETGAKTKEAEGIR